MKKLTKSLSKSMSLILALCLCLCTMFVSTMAANITISNGNDSATYEAYKLLNLTTSTSGDTTNYAYTVNSKYASLLRSVTGQSSDVEVVEYISNLNASDTRTFADSVFHGLGGLDPDYTSSSNVISNVDQGYYLVVETTVVDGTQQSRSLVMLNTAGQDDLTISAKTDVPSVEKKILEDEDSSTVGWNDVADYDIGDDVAYRSTGTLPDNIANYNTYTYIFHDTMDSGLSFNGDVSVAIDGSTVDTSCYTVNTSCDDGCTFEVIFTNLKDATSSGSPISLTASSTVVVSYSAELTENAVVGLPGNENEVYLEFSNDVYDTSSTGETPEDVVVCFTFSVSVSKVDSAGSSLENAQFLLYADQDCTQLIKLSQAGDGSYYLDPDAADNGATVVAGTNVIIKGLEADATGTIVYLKETAAPDGYNELTSPIAITLTGTYTHRNDYVSNTSTQALTGLTAQANINGSTTNLTTDISSGAASNVVLQVINTTGTQLPATGDNGRTLMYICGGALLLSALVFAGCIVIRRKRSSN